MLYSITHECADDDDDEKWRYYHMACLGASVATVQWLMADQTAAQVSQVTGGILTHHLTAHAGLGDQLSAGGAWFIVVVATVGN